MQVYTIPAGADFLAILAASLLQAAGHRDSVGAVRLPPPEARPPALRLDEADPFALADVTVLLPTRRAVAALRTAFLRAHGGRPLLLPRLLPLGDIDLEDAITADSGAGAFNDDDDAAAAGLGDGSAASALPPAIDGFRRRVLLARVIAAVDADRGIDQALQLADALGALLDQLQAEGIAPEQLETLPVGELARHWEKSLAVLRILWRRWPEILAAEGAVDPAARRNAALAALAAGWAGQPPPGPVIAAGSTGSQPATAALLEAIAGLPRGAVILPGLDRALSADDEGAVRADATHPQHGLLRLLDRFGLAPAVVADWPGASPAGGEGAPAAARRALLREAMRPAAATHHWRDASARIAARLADGGGDPLAGLVRLDCLDAEDEAATIAVLMREVLETPGRTAALVTPDRALGRRVALRLRRWGIGIDDSAGLPLRATPPAVFLRLLVRVAAEAAAPVPLLALLQHPLFALQADGGHSRGDARRRVHTLDRLLLRGPRPAAGVSQLIALAEAEAASPERPAGERTSIADVLPFLDAFAAALGPLEAALADTAPLPAETLAAATFAAAEACSDPAQLWAKEDGQALAALVQSIDRHLPLLGPVPPARWPALFDACFDGQVVRRPWGGHPRLAILGTLEARLIAADRVILAGLNDGIWPAAPTPDPFLSRPMREALGLPTAARRIGLAAHDFVQGASHAEVILTRSVKEGGAATTPSPWLLRLDAVLAASGSAALSPAALRAEAGERALNTRLAQARDHARALDRAVLAPLPAAGFAPCVEARRRTLSVSALAELMADPYSHVAHRILKLEPLDAVDAPPSAAERGTIVHAALEAFIRELPEGPLPGDALDRLLAHGRAAFEAMLLHPTVAAFWWPRFAQVARFIVAHEAERRPALARAAVERSGAMTLAGIFAGSDRPDVTLTAKADRIDLWRDGRAAIIDYKTGTPPGIGQVARGLFPQLPVEAAILAAGGFSDFPADTQAASLEYWKLTGGKIPGKVTIVAGEGRKAGGRAPPHADDAPAFSAMVMAAVERVLRDGADPKFVYKPARDRPKYDNFAHLARIAQALGDGDETEAGGGEDGA